MKDFATICTGTIQNFIKEYGDKKHRQIYDELINSSSFKKNWPIITTGGRAPNSSELLTIVQNIRFFAFSNKRNTTIAVTILLIMWNGECNRNNEVCEDEQLLNILEKVTEKSSNLLW